MLLTIIEFAIVTIGVKFALGLWIIYLLLPSDRRCPACDAETLPLTARRGWKLLGRLTRIHRRWCLGCGATMMARRPAASVKLAEAAVPAKKVGRPS